MFCASSQRALYSRKQLYMDVHDWVGRLRTDTERTHGTIGRLLHPGKDHNQPKVVTRQEKHLTYEFRSSMECPIRVVGPEAITMGRV